MEKTWHIPRRTFLRGLGAMIALPTLEAMAPPLKALAAGTGEVLEAAPKRMAFVYIPNGVIMEHWTPQAVGANFDLPNTLSPLKPFQSDITVLSGLAHEKAKANGDGGGDHARANATFLTGRQARKTAGADIRIGISVDQVAAQVAGRQTKLPSLELSCDKGRQAGACDSGYSCAYQFNLSWKSEATPMSPEADPRLVFERMFGSRYANESKEGRERRKLYEKSILDFVLEDANQLKRNLGANDKQKLDEYLTAVRETEQRIERAERNTNGVPEFKVPDGIPQDFGQHTRLMFDLMTLAFQTDTTRVSTFLMAHDGSNRSYNFLGFGDGHHNLSHHENKQPIKDKLAKIDYFHMQQFAYFLERLKSVKEGNGTLLDNCMIVYGGGISNGNAHSHENLPIVLAGNGGSTIKTGRHLKINKTPMTNLYLAMLARMGINAQRFGDSTGVFNGLT